MAKTLTSTLSALITDTGTEVVNREKIDTREIDEYARFTARLAGSGAKTFCVEGTDVAAVTDPVVLPLSEITGFYFYATGKVDVTIDGGASSSRRRRLVSWRLPTLRGKSTR